MAVNWRELNQTRVDKEVPPVRRASGYVLLTHFHITLQSESAIELCQFLSVNRIPV
jgi:hypothetical protein